MRDIAMQQQEELLNAPCNIPVLPDGGDNFDWHSDGIDTLINLDVDQLTISQGNLAIAVDFHMTQLTDTDMQNTIESYRIHELSIFNDQLDAYYAIDSCNVGESTVKKTLVKR